MGELQRQLEESTEDLDSQKRSYMKRIAALNAEVELLTLEAAASSRPGGTGEGESTTHFPCPSFFLSFFDSFVHSFIHSCVNYFADDCSFARFSSITFLNMHTISIYITYILS